MFFIDLQHLIHAVEIDHHGAIDTPGGTTVAIVTSLRTSPQRNLVRAGNTHDSLELTPAGEQLLPKARILLDAATQVDATTKASQDEHSGLLRVGCYDVIAPAYLPKLMAEFRDIFPDVTVNIVEDSQNGLIDALDNSRIDVAITYLRGLPITVATSLICRPTPHIIVSTGHRLAGSEITSLAELRGEPLILLDAAPGREIILDLYSDNEIEPYISYASKNFDHVRAMVGQNLGYSVISQTPGTTPAHWGDRVCAIPLTEADRFNDLVAAFPKDAPLSKRAKNFIAIARELYSVGL